MTETWWLALLGGALIGTASALLWLTHGRIAGISGIVGGLVRAPAAGGWRLAFLGGLIGAGLVAKLIGSDAIGSPDRSLAMVVVAGLLVGVGTQIGSGCTSGHGVCGLARWSRRSAVAVATFMGAAALTVWLAGGSS